MPPTSSFPLVESCIFRPRFHFRFHSFYRFSGRTLLYFIHLLSALVDLSSECDDGAVERMVYVTSHTVEHSVLTFNTTRIFQLMYVSMSTQTRHSVADVPLELWQIIASFLSSEDVKKLYGLNRPLSALAMEERCRSVSIGDLHDRETIWALQRLTYARGFNHFVLYEPPSPA